MENCQSRSNFDLLAMDSHRKEEKCGSEITNACRAVWPEVYLQRVVPSIWFMRLVLA